MSRKILSIITVCYNSEQTIQRCVDSIVEQLNDKIEYLIIDGASTDNTIARIKKYKEIRYISEKDSGIYNAMNKGILKAEGDWILFINSDDSLMPNVLKEILPYLNEKIDCLYGDVRGVIYDGEDKYYKDIKAREIDALFEHMIACHQSIFMRKSMMKKLGGFNEKYKIAADWDLFIKVRKNNYMIKYIPQIISEFDMGGVSNTKTYILELHRIRKENRLYTFFDKCFLKDFKAVIGKYRNRFLKIVLRDKFEEIKRKHNKYIKVKIDK